VPMRLKSCNRSRLSLTHSKSSFFCLRATNASVSVNGWNMFLLLTPKRVWARCLAGYFPDRARVYNFVPLPGFMHRFGCQT
jgi:hypothetical protein